MNSTPSRGSSARIAWFQHNTATTAVTHDDVSSCHVVTAASPGAVGTVSAGGRRDFQGEDYRPTSRSAARVAQGRPVQRPAAPCGQPSEPAPSSDRSPRRAPRWDGGGVRRHPSTVATPRCDGAGGRRRARQRRCRPHSTGYDQRHRQDDQRDAAWRGRLGNYEAGRLKPGAQRPPSPAHGSARRRSGLARASLEEDDARGAITGWRVCRPASDVPRPTLATANIPPRQVVVTAAAPGGWRDIGGHWFGRCQPAPRAAPATVAHRPLIDVFEPPSAASWMWLMSVLLAAGHRHYTRAPTPRLVVGRS